MGLKFLSTQDEITIWDNLFYQTIARTSVYVREALIQMLIANKFLAHFNQFSQGLSGDVIFTEDQEIEFKRVAFSSVVINKALLLESYTTGSNTKPRKVSGKQQKRLSDLLIAKYDATALNMLESELKAAQKAYNEKEYKTYEEALANHQKVVDGIIKEGRTELVDEWDVEKQASIKIEKFVHEDLPKFEYPKK